MENLIWDRQFGAVDRAELVEKSGIVSLRLTGMHQGKKVHHTVELYDRRSSTSLVPELITVLTSIEEKKKLYKDMIKEETQEYVSQLQKAEEVDEPVDNKKKAVTCKAEGK